MLWKCNFLGFWPYCLLPTSNPELLLTLIYMETIGSKQNLKKKNIRSNVGQMQKPIPCRNLSFLFLSSEDKIPCEFFSSLSLTEFMLWMPHVVALHLWFHIFLWMHVVDMLVDSNCSAATQLTVTQSKLDPILKLQDFAFNFVT